MRWRLSVRAARSESSHPPHPMNANPSCTSRVGPTLCQLCNANLENLTASQRQQHYDVHLDPSSSSTRGLAYFAVRLLTSFIEQPSSSSRKSTISKDLFKPLRLQKPERKKSEDDFWYPAQSRPPPDNYSPGMPVRVKPSAQINGSGLVTLLKQALKKHHARGTIHRAVLCFEGAMHISHETFDRGWGCGYVHTSGHCRIKLTCPHLDIVISSWHVLHS